MKQSTPTKWMQPQTILFWILAFSVMLRILAALYLGNQVVDMPGTADQISYHSLALRVMGGHGFTFGQDWWPITRAGTPTAHWSFLYTFYLIGVYAIFGVAPLAARIIQAIVVGILHPYLAYLLGREVVNRKVGLVAAGLTALYAYFIYYAGALMTEPFYITAILAALYLAIRFVKQSPEKNGNSRRLLAALGLCLGIAVLLRQLLLIIVPILLLWILWNTRKLGPQAALRTLLIPAVIILCMILPFTIFNYSRFHRLVLLNTNAGYALFWGNHPIYGTHFVGILPPEMGTYQSLIPQELRSLDEAALDQALSRRAMQFILDDPVRYVLLSISRIPVYFQFWPSSGSGMMSNLSRVASFGILLPFMLYGLVRLWIERKIARIEQPAFLLMLFVVAYTGIHLLSWALIRYRLPVDAILLIAAALALTDLYDRLFPHKVISPISE